MNPLLEKLMFSNCMLVLPAHRTMEAQEWGESAPRRGDDGTGTQGSPVGPRSGLVHVDRELCAIDRQLVPDSNVESRQVSTDKLATKQQAVPPLTSTALRGLPHPAPEHDSGSRRPRPPFHCSLGALLLG